MLKGKKILIGITGSIAAYKIPVLVRLLVKEGAEVKVVLTETARDFITPLTLSTLSGHPVFSDFYDKNDGSWHSHVELGNWADLFLIAPVTATTMGKMANGIADNLLTATYLAAKCPVFFAPAMDVDMFHHPSTGVNIQKLKSYGNILIPPDDGELASGLYGEGRMQEPENILDTLKEYFQKKKEFTTLNVLISAGPTYEAIDPVRFISNHSSGKMGFALALEFAERGANVELVSGPVSLLADHPRIHLTKVTAAAEMHRECLRLFGACNVAVMAAAIADFTPEHAESGKIKKQSDTMTLQLKRTTDVLNELGKKKKENQILAGFALETDNEIENARLKLKNKNLDLIVLNSLKDEGAGFGFDTNKISILTKNGEIIQYGVKLKREAARDIADKINELLIKSGKENQ